jgi:protein-tyrosine phosphatase
MRLRRQRPVDASEVLPGLLVGSAPDAAQCAELSRRGVSVVVDLRAEVPNEGHWPSCVVIRRMPVVDRGAPDHDQLADLTRWVVAAMRRREIVLLHCHAGMGRAATAACAVLLELGYSLTDACTTVRDARPTIAPTDPQIALLRQMAAGSGVSVRSRS